MKSEYEKGREDGYAQVGLDPNKSEEYFEGYQYGEGERQKEFGFCHDCGAGSDGQPGTCTC